MFIDSEALAAPGSMVYRRSIGSWDQPHGGDQLDESQGDRIIENIRLAFDFKGYQLRVIRSACSVGSRAWKEASTLGPGRRQLRTTTRSARRCEATPLFLRQRGAGGRRRRGRGFGRRPKRARGRARLNARSLRKRGSRTTGAGTTEAACRPESPATLIKAPDRCRLLRSARRVQLQRPRRHRPGRGCNAGVWGRAIRAVVSPEGPARDRGS